MQGENNGEHRKDINAIMMQSMIVKYDSIHVSGVNNVLLCKHNFYVFYLKM